MSDVKLVEGAVVIEAWDLRLDAPDRRKNNSAFRRALVHDTNDGLTLNWGEDYPGGVTVLGTVNMGDVTIHKSARIGEALLHKANINGTLTVALNVKPNGTIGRTPANMTDEQFQNLSGASMSYLLQTVQQGVTQEFNVKVDAIDAIAMLSTLVNNLQDRVKKLEAKLPG